MNHTDSWELRIVQSLEEWKRLVELSSWRCSCERDTMINNFPEAPLLLADFLVFFCFLLRSVDILAISLFPIRLPEFLFLETHEPCSLFYCNNQESLISGGRSCQFPLHLILNLSALGTSKTMSSTWLDWQRSQRSPRYNSLSLVETSSSRGRYRNGGRMEYEWGQP